MTQTLNYDRREETHIATYTCNECGATLGSEPYTESKVHNEFKGRNDGIGNISEHFCKNCQDRWNRAYDDYVDPLHMYH